MHGISNSVEYQTLSVILMYFLIKKSRNILKKTSLDIKIFLGSLFMYVVQLLIVKLAGKASPVAWSNASADLAEKIFVDGINKYNQGKADYLP